jgi:glycosyltransferase involved in cell wall biosynthesis
MIQDELCRLACADADIIHLQRVMIEDTHRYITYWKSLGKAVVVDFDDRYRLIDETNAAAPFWLHGEVEVTLGEGVKYKKELDKHPIEQFKQGIKLCTAGITPSVVLSDSWEDHVPMFVIRNYLDSSAYHSVPKQDNSPNIILGWGGSLSHQKGWAASAVNEALKRILQERENVYLLIIGDENITKNLPVPRHKVLHMPYVAWWHWQKTLKRYDIGLAPLAGDYDDGRSNLKVAEYLMGGIPFVASKSPVYREFWDADSGHFVKHGHDKHHYDERAEDWYSSTIDIIDNIEYYRKKASMNIDKIGMTYDVDRNVEQIIKTYQEIIDLER